MDKNVTIALPVAAWNVVVTALAARPYAEVSELVDELRRQAGPQIQALEAAEKSEEVESDE